MTVYLVGAGPGDAGLVTVRGADLLRRADAVVHDRLVHPGLLALAPATAELHDVGKRPGSNGASQEATNELLVSLGGRLGCVVRLKGGDPFVFGRGGEETQSLLSASIPFEIVPGVSAVTGVPAFAGVPLTHRGKAAAFTVVTGHGADRSAVAGPTPVDWDAVAKVGGTIVILMGVEHRAEIADRLVAGGRSPSEPVAVVQSGTLPSQHVTRTTLGGLGEAEVGAPATIIVGVVAGLDFSWFSPGPLAGWQVAVTRAREQSSSLSVALRTAGAEVLEVPTISIAAPGDGGAGLRRAAAGLSSYDWTVFTSENAVAALFAELRDARALGGCKVACVGSATASALASRGVTADLVPESFVGEALVAAFPPAPRRTPQSAAGASPGRVLLPQAAGARDVVAAGLAELGWEVDAVEAYCTVPAVLQPSVLARGREVDCVTFTSSSTVGAWLGLFGATAVPRVVACIGPITAARAREAGLEVHVEAASHSVAGLVEALCAYARSVDVVA